MKAPVRFSKTPNPGVSQVFLTDEMIAEFASLARRTAGRNSYKDTASLFENIGAPEVARGIRDLDPHPPIHAESPVPA